MKMKRGKRYIVLGCVTTSVENHPVNAKCYWEIWARMMDNENINIYYRKCFLLEGVIKNKIRFVVLKRNLTSLIFNDIYSLSNFLRELWYQVRKVCRITITIWRWRVYDTISYTKPLMPNTIWDSDFFLSLKWHSTLMTYYQVDKN